MSPPLFSRPTRGCLNELDFDRLLAGEQADLETQRTHLRQCRHCRSTLAALVAEQERTHPSAHVAEHAARLMRAVRSEDGEQAQPRARAGGSDGTDAAEELASQRRRQAQPDSSTAADARRAPLGARRCSRQKTR